MMDKPFKPSNLFSSLLKLTENFISVPECFVCGKTSGKREMKMNYLCMDCWFAAPFAIDSAEVYNQLVRNFKENELAVSNAFALLKMREDSRYMELIYALKYYGFRKTGFDLGRELGRMIMEQGTSDCSLIIPVPIHSARMRERGFNQSETIARGISAAMHIPFESKLLIRKKYTTTQTMLKKEERKKNVTGVFTMQSDKSIIEGKRILLVDDVLTSGSTINSAAKCLIENGALSIDSATLVVA